MESPNDSLSFATSADEDTDRYYKALLRPMVAETVRELSDAEPFSLVLSGSLALGEGCAFGSVNREFTPGSDIDLYVITAEKNLDRVGGRVSSLRSRLLDSLATPGLILDMGVISPERLRRLTPTVANCLLARYGKVLWGDATVLEAAPRFRFEEIPPWDGLLLLLNRTAEELTELRLRPSGEREVTEFWYRFGKTVRDLGTSAMVVGGRFRPLLEERRDGMLSFLEREKLGSLVPEYAPDYTFWCDQKKNPSSLEASRRYGNGDSSYRAAQLRKQNFLDAFWTWETKQVFRTREGEGVLAAHRRGEPLRRRARSWAGHWVRGRASGFRNTLWHLLRGLPLSPLLANYTAAVFLLLSWGPVLGDTPTDRDRSLLDQAHRLAPVRPVAPGKTFRERWTGLRDAVCEFWNREVMGGTRPALPLEKR